MIKNVDSTAIESVIQASGRGTSPTMTAKNLNKTRVVMASTGNDLSRLGKSKVGGNWTLYKWAAERRRFSAPIWQYGTNTWYGGDFVADVANELDPSTQISSTLLAMQSESRSKGPQAIAMSNPVRPEVDMGTAVGEIVTGGLPSIVGHSLWRERAQLARGAGSEYLNYQFGWVPFVNDIRNFAKTVIDSEKIVSQFEKGSGVRQRRRFRFPATFESSTTVDGTSNLYPYQTGMFDNGKSVIIDTSESELWFAGAFKYYVPESGLKRYSALASKLYGANLTPATLWNLAPWSWAADWFGNVGHVMENISYLGSDATVMEWGYVMNRREQSRRIITTVTGNSRSSNPLRNSLALAETSIQSSFKTRVVGSPYSFSAQPAPLSGKQLAILAALGLSRT